MRDRILDVGVDEPVGVDAPLLHRHRGDHVRRQTGLGLKRLFAGEAPVGMRVLQRLEAVVHLHGSLHALDVVAVMRHDRDQKDHAVNQVAGDRHDVPGVDARQPGRVPVELEVARPAVDHPARGPTRAGPPVAFFEQQDRKPA